MSKFGDVWREFYDEDTKEFTLSCLRDLYKTGLCAFIAVGVRYLTRFMVLAGFHHLITEAVEVIDGAWLVGTIAFGAIDFLGKLIFRRRDEPK